MTEETSSLLTALNAVDHAMADIMVGLMADSLTADEQVRFGDLFLGAGRLLHQHAGNT